MDRFGFHGIDVIGVTPFPVRQSVELESSSAIAQDRQQKLHGLAKIRRELVRMGDEAQRLWANARAWPRLAGLPRYRPDRSGNREA